MKKPFIHTLQMLKIGTVVLVMYPAAYAGIRGRLLDREESGRWIVQLEENPIEEDDDPLILSLEESEFEVIER